MKNKINYPVASDGLPAIPKTLSNLSTHEQVETIKDLSNKLSISIDEISQKLFSCSYDMLSKSGANDVIQHLNQLLPEGKRAKILPFVKPKEPKQKLPHWLQQLHLMARANMPLFIGRLEDDWWKEDEFLVNGIEKGWIEIIPEKGFLITEAGKDIVRENGLDMTPDNPPSYYEKLVEDYKAEKLRWSLDDKS